MENDEFSTHEIVDRLSLSLSFIDDFLLGHQSISHHPHEERKIAQASKLLAECYQSIGAKHFE